MVQMLFRLIDGKVKRLLSNEREGRKGKRLRNRRARRKKEREKSIQEQKYRNKAVYHMMFTYLMIL